MLFFYGMPPNSPYPSSINNFILANLLPLSKGGCRFWSPFQLVCMWCCTSTFVTKFWPASLGTIPTVCIVYMCTCPLLHTVRSVSSLEAYLKYLPQEESGMWLQIVKWDFWLFCGYRVHLVESPLTCSHHVAQSSLCFRWADLDNGFLALRYTRCTSCLQLVRRPC